MLVIRDAQMGVFAQEMERSHEERLLEHLARWLPAMYQRVGPEGTRALIRASAARAGAYGVLSKRGVARYLRLQFAFGAEFERDPRHPWAMEILADAARMPEQRMADFYVAAIDRFREHALASA